MAKSSRRLSEHERAERRRQDRERLQRAAEELLCSEGWARWVRVRAMFHSYSASNCMLLATQCHERGIVPTRIAGFRTWLKLGRCVRKGEVALRILAPVTVKQRDEHDEESGERRVFFKTAFVFDVSQTEIRDGAETVALEPPERAVDRRLARVSAQTAAGFCGVAGVLGVVRDDRGLSRWLVGSEAQADRD
jgi:hypothetical protein